jgi:methyl-accepting chemotaxis protein
MTQEQAMGIEQINKAAGQIYYGVQENAPQVEQQAAK